MLLTKIFKFKIPVRLYFEEVGQTFGTSLLVIGRVPWTTRQEWRLTYSTKSNPDDAINTDTDR